MGKLLTLVRQNSYGFTQPGSSTKNIHLCVDLNLCLKLTSSNDRTKNLESISDIFLLEDQFVLLYNVHQTSSAEDLSLYVVI